MAVSVHGNSEGRMTEPFLDYLGIGAFLEHKRGVEVSPIILMAIGKFDGYTLGVWLSNR